MPIELTKFWNRVVEAAETEDVSEIARMTKSTAAGIYKWRDGGGPGLELVINLSDSTGVALDWLLFEEGPKYRHELQTFSRIQQGHFLAVVLPEPLDEKVKELAFNHGFEPADEAADLIKDGLLVRGEITDELEGREGQGAILIDFGEYSGGRTIAPLLGEIAMGEPLHIVEEEGESVEIPAIYKIPGREIFVLRARGDSLIDEAILDGDLLVCAKTDEARNGQLVVALVDGDKATVKRFFRGRREIILRPANPLYRDIVLPPERVKVQAIVIGILRQT